MNASVTHPDKELFWNFSPDALTAHSHASVIRLLACSYDKTNEDVRRANRP